MITIGAPGSNYRSRDIVQSTANEVIVCGPENMSGCFATTTRPTDYLCQPKGFDLGIILKLTPRALPNRVWIMCAGIGEWGTSAAAFHLSRSWRDLAKLFGRHDFAAVIKVRKGDDATAERIAASGTAAQLDDQLASASIRRERRSSEGARSVSNVHVIRVSGHPEHVGEDGSNYRQ